MSIDWIEAHPTPDAVRIKLDGENITKEIAFPREDVIGNLDNSRRVVVFNACAYFASDSSESALLKKNGRMRVLLLKGGSPVSEWCIVNKNGSCNDHD